MLAGREYFKDWHRRLEEREGQLLGQLDQHLKVASKQVDAERSTFVQRSDY